MSRVMRVLLWASLVCLLIATVPLSATADTGIGVGDYLTMGVDENGSPILWRCVAMREEGPLMVSHKVITYKAFDAATGGAGSSDSSESPQALRAAYGSNNWKNSTLRKWLNSQGKITWDAKIPDASAVLANPYEDAAGFLSNFSAEELEAVKTVNNKTAVNAADTPDTGEAVHEYSLDWQLADALKNYDTAYAQYTQDRFFCLSIPEVIALGTNFGGYEVGYPTDYAAGLCEAFYIDDVGATYYWLRDAYADYKFPEGVRCLYPASKAYYYNAHNGNIGVRPAFVLAVTNPAYGSGTISDPYRVTAETGVVGSSQEGNDVTYVGSVGVSSVQGTYATLAIGDYITMGTLDDAPILWRCVDIDENGPLLLSDKLLRFYCFDAKSDRHANDASGLRAQYGSNRWSVSTLRHWLNSDLESWGNWEGVAVPERKNIREGYSSYVDTPGFLTAFSPLEQSMIKEVSLYSMLNAVDVAEADVGTQVNDLRRKIQLLDNYAEAYKEKTTDKIFLLNRVQAKQVYDLFEDYILASPTPGALVQSEYINTALSVGKTWHYWLRDAFGDEKYPYYTFDITTDGRISCDQAYSAQYGVRPCFYLNMQTLQLVSGKGTATTPYEVKAHNLGERTVVAAALCTQAGKAEQVCTDCGYTATYAIEAVGHTFLEKITPQTPLFDEKTTKYCTVCGVAEYTLGGTARPLLVVLIVAAVLIVVALIFAISHLRRGKMKPMKNVLVLFAKEFPYNHSEPFLEAEYPLYKEYFDKVLIVTNRPSGGGVRSVKTREVNDPAVEILESCFGKGIKGKCAFMWAVLTDIHTYTELIRIIFHHKASPGAIRNMVISIGKANLCAKLAHKRCRQLEKEGYGVTAAYAYWLIYPAYAAVRFSRKYYGGRLYTVSRAHAFDFYESRHPGNYIVCRKYVLSGLSEIACISEDGKRYLAETYPGYSMNITIHRLGARDMGVIRSVEKGNVFKIISCSRVVPVKRVHRIVDALAKMPDVAIEWTHCGGGALLDEVKAKAATLPANIRCTFTGTIPNTAVYDLYRNNDYHVFLNVSQSEGVPVSIMEAMSFGLPVIATDVGGTAETIDVGESGYLLPMDYCDEELTEHLYRLIQMDQADYDAMRHHAREKFEREYNAIPNYHKFLKSLLSNCEDSTEEELWTTD